MFFAAAICPVMMWKLASQSDAAHSDRLLDSLFVVHDVFLRKNVNDLLTRKHHKLVHVFHQRIDVILRDLSLPSCFACGSRGAVNS